MYLCVSSIERQGPLLQGRFVAHLSMLLTLHTLVFFAFEFSAAQQEAASPHAASSSDTSATAIQIDLPPPLSSILDLMGRTSLAQYNLYS